MHDKQRSRISLLRKINVMESLTEVTLILVYFRKSPQTVLMRSVADKTWLRCIQITTALSLQAMTSLIQSATAITNAYNLCVYHKVFCFIPEGHATGLGLEHPVSKSVCEDVILRFCCCLRKKNMMIFRLLFRKPTFKQSHSSGRKDIRLTNLQGRYTAIVECF